MDLTIEPTVGSGKFDITNIPQVTSILADLVRRAIKKVTFPYKSELDLPMAFRAPKVTLKEE